MLIKSIAILDFLYMYLRKSLCGVAKDIATHQIVGAIMDIVM